MSASFNRGASCVWIVGAIACLTSAAGAAFIDNLDTAGNFSGSFGGTTATANGDGTVTLTRTTANVDAGIDWNPGGPSRIPLNFAHNTLIVDPVTPVDGGYYSISLLFFNSGGGFIAEPNWITDSNSVAVQTLSSVAEFATTNGVSNAASYFVRFRIQPFVQETPDPAFTFTQINAIPEPTAAAVIMLGLIAVRARRRAER